MKSSSLAIYFTFLAVFCAAIIAGAKMLGQQGAYLAQLYMLTPALAALLTRLYFYKPRFSDANLRFGKIRHYLIFWIMSISITAQVFLGRLAQQFAAAGQDMNAALPPGFTPQTMLLIYFVGGLTVFNIFP